jgi:hypothetical protein
VVEKVVDLIGFSAIYNRFSTTNGTITDNSLELPDA